ncbi:hypothetical protein [Streptomyces sp. URMC 129]|uniref:hypothetical protein n=1 Tax=Streptomyces sp. URMC 129 TaxID=3423407 RepID=UPI003F1ACEBB
MRSGRPSPEADSSAPAATAHGPVSGTDDPGVDEDADENADHLASALLRVHAERMRQITREERTRARFTALHPEVPVTEVAALAEDVHDLAGLRAIGDRLASWPPADAGDQPTPARSPKPS